MIYSISDISDLSNLRRLKTSLVLEVYRLNNALMIGMYPSLRSVALKNLILYIETD